MQKDVIYIDVDDDITAIIGKIKSSSHKIIALVPPKRIGVLQSAVNLRLIQRAAKHEDKKLVLISNNPALMSLAAAASIPVAKNLQSRPELAEIPALDVDDGEDVIDGAQLPVGDHAKMVESDVKDDDKTDNAVDEISAASAAGAASAASLVAAKKSSKKSSSFVKVPNFGSARKKIFFAVGAGALLVGLLIWALIFAPNARIIIAARTTESAASHKVTLGDKLATDFQNKTIKSISKEIKKDISIPINATGKKDVGEKATGMVRFVASSEDAIADGVTIPAGTKISAQGGSAYTTSAAASIPATPSRDIIRGNYGSATVAIVAAAPGTSYNGASGAANGPSGVTTNFVNSTSGGTDKTVPVVTQGDIDTATAKVGEGSDNNTIQTDLAKQLNGAIVLSSSFKSDTSSVKPNVTADQEFGTTTPAVKGQAIYTLMAVERSEMSKFLTAAFDKEIDGTSNQKVYNNGADKATFTNVAPQEGVFAATLTANGKIGPKIDDNAIKEYAKGKRFGEIQSHIESINGVDSVDVKFSPFWVTAAPNDTKRIKVEFKLNDQ